MKGAARGGPRIAGACLVLAAALGGCAPPEVSGTVVSGKVAYRGMAIEAAEVRALRWEGGAWGAAAATQSGYHGSFALRLPAGRYRLEARVVLAVTSGAIPLRGVAESLELSPGLPRLDRVLVELHPE